MRDLRLFIRYKLSCRTIIWCKNAILTFAPVTSGKNCSTTASPPTKKPNLCQNSDVSEVKTWGKTVTSLWIWDVITWHDDRMWAVDVMVWLSKTHNRCWTKLEELLSNTATLQLQVPIHKNILVKTNNKQLRNKMQD